MNLAELKNWLRPLSIRITNTVARGVLYLVNDAKRMQLLQVGALAGETIAGKGEGAEHFQPYGFSSVPLAGAEVVVLCPDGDRTRAVVLSAADRRHRPTGGSGGEVCMYTDEGDVIRLGRGHIISLETTGQVRLGSATAAEGAIKGTSRNAAEQTFLTALGTLVAAIVDGTGAPAPAKAAFAAALATFQSAAAAAVSTKVKLE